MTRRIGVACNQNLALINHACDPNYGRVWLHLESGHGKLLNYNHIYVIYPSQPLISTELNILSLELHSI